jgi:hypothetical protein
LPVPFLSLRSRPLNILQHRDPVFAPEARDSAMQNKPCDSFVFLRVLCG